MSRASFVLLIMVAVLWSTTIAQRNPRCPKNQEWTSCGSACPPSCNDSPDRACTMQCVEGCQCISGLLFNGSGDCVHPSKC